MGKRKKEKHNSMKMKNNKTKHGGYQISKTGNGEMQIGNRKWKIEKPKRGEWGIGNNK